MKKIIWDDKFSVGVDWIDEQHKQVINMINQMIDCPEECSNNSEALHEVLNQMFKYSLEHLHDEEIMLIKNHLRYTEKLANLSLRAMSHGDTVGEELLSFLSEWWREHILKEDMKFKDFVQ